MKRFRRFHTEDKQSQLFDRVISVTVTFQRSLSPFRHDLVTGPHESSSQGHSFGRIGFNSAKYISSSNGFEYTHRQWTKQFASHTRFVPKTFP